jgi:hypothetical protein
MPFSHRRAEKFLLFWGVLLIAGTAVLVGLELGGRISGQSILVIAAGSVAGSGIALSGLRAYRSASGRWVRLPAFTLIGVGGILALGSPVVFRPWSYDGLAAGVAGMFTAMVFLVGIGCLLIGGYCAIRETVRPALAMTAVVAGMGWGYVFQLQQYTSGLSDFLLGTLFIVVVLPPVALVLRWPLAVQKETGTDVRG